MSKECCKNYTVIWLYVSLEYQFNHSWPVCGRRLLPNYQLFFFVEFVSLLAPRLELRNDSNKNSMRVIDWTKCAFGRSRLKPVRSTWFTFSLPRLRPRWRRGIEKQCAAGIMRGYRGTYLRRVMHFEIFKGNAHQSSDETSSIHIWWAFHLISCWWCRSSCSWCFYCC